MFVSLFHDLKETQTALVVSHLQSFFAKKDAFQALAQDAQRFFDHDILLTDAEWELLLIQPECKVSTQLTVGSFNNGKRLKPETASTFTPGFFYKDEAWAAAKKVGTTPAVVSAIPLAERFYNVRTGNALIRFDSYMLPEDELTLGMFRNLEVDQRAILPEKIHVRVLVTSDDVLHSWAIPSLGVKMDACPGRLNQTEIFAKRTGVFYGQCSEICGVNHGFMPIVVEIVHPNNYANWIYNQFLGK